MRNFQRIPDKPRSFLEIRNVGILIADELAKYVKVIGFNQNNRSMHMTKPDTIIGYVVLHYFSYDSTIQTIQSIIDHDESAVIVLVDNCSPNGSGKSLREKFTNQANIEVVLLKENLGFAKGNNAGYKILKEKYNVDYICILNNDVLILDSDMKQKLFNVYRLYGFGILGPRIIHADGSENIFNKKLPPIEYYENLLEQTQGLLNQVKNRSDLSLYIGDKIKKFKQVISHKIKKNNPDTNIDFDALLHGCCIFFSPQFINKFDDAFYPETFLYGEEELLYLKCQRNGLKSVYYPSITIQHLEDVATNSSMQQVKERQVRKLTNSIASLKIIIKTYKDPSALVE